MIPPRSRSTRRNRLYLRTHHSITAVLHRALARREINLRPLEICRAAHISAPTFYYHCHNANDALHTYESTLEQDFKQSVARYYYHAKQHQHRTLLFSLLLTFISEHHAYFTATIRSNDFYLLARLIDRLRIGLLGPRITNPVYFVYRAHIIAIIQIWFIEDHHAPARIDFYLKKLLYLRPQSF